MDILSRILRGVIKIMATIIVENNQTSCFRCFFLICSSFDANFKSIYGQETANDCL